MQSCGVYLWLMWWGSLASLIVYEQLLHVRHVRVLIDRSRCFN